MRGQPVTFQSFADGVNLESAPYNLGDGEARDARNVQSTVRGAIRKRPGTTQLASPGVQLTSLYGASGVAFLIAAGGTQLFAIDSAGVSTALIGSLTGGLRWSFVEAPVTATQGPVFGMNGAEARETDGTAGGTGAWTAATGNLPIGKHLAYHGNSVWVAGMAALAGAIDARSALAWSLPGQPRDWPATNIVEFDPGDGDELQGIGPAGPNLLVFKADKSWLVYDLETGANRPLSDKVGCVAHRSIVATQHGTFFLSRDQGVMLTDGSKIQRVGDKIMPLLRLIPAAQRQLATAAFFDGHYYLAISTGAGANNLLLDYDVQLQSWWVHSLGVAALTTWDEADLRLYGARSTAAPVDRLMVPGVFTDAGSAYTSYWRGPFHTFKTPHRRKRVHAIHFDGKGRIVARAFRDFNLGAEQLADVDFTSADRTWGGDGTWGGAGAWGDEAEVQERIILTPGVARAWSVELASITADEFEIESYTFFLRDRTS